MLSAKHRNLCTGAPYGYIYFPCISRPCRLIRISDLHESLCGLLPPCNNYLLHRSPLNESTGTLEWQCVPWVSHQLVSMDVMAHGNESCEQCAHVTSSAELYNWENGLCICISDACIMQADYLAIALTSVSALRYVKLTCLSLHSIV